MIWLAMAKCFQRKNHKRWGMENLCNLLLLSAPGERSIMSWRQGPRLRLIPGFPQLCQQEVLKPDQEHLMLNLRTVKVRNNGKLTLLGDEILLCTEPSLLQSVIAARTRGRTVEKDSVFVLRHIPVHGGKSPVDIPDAVQLTHTG
mmetsp:Transcript_17792/g.40281  ORF Transcript_17792/g.40281 Transcript_17792/m.40281 type:complete len:145 (-) Transcript_17792:3401-3835(-)